jgi:hypothetical protein
VNRSSGGAKADSTSSGNPTSLAKPQTGRSKNELYQSVQKTFMEQSEGWKKRNLFERQWVSRDFKKNTGFSIDEMQTKLKALGDKIKDWSLNGRVIDTSQQNRGLLLHQQEQLKGFEKNQQKLAENLKIMDGWIEDGLMLAVSLPQSQTSLSPPAAKTDSPWQTDTADSL